MDDSLEQVPTPADPPPLVREYRPRIGLPVALFLITCWSTWSAGTLPYAIAIMSTLLAHEMGHYLQARRNRVPASLPYFIPMPGSPIGTMGAVIAMQPGIGNRRSLFDIGVSGPLAGLVPTMIFSIVGLCWSTIEPIAAHQNLISLGEPLLFRILGYCLNDGCKTLAFRRILKVHILAGWRTTARGLTAALTSNTILCGSRSTGKRY